MAARLSAQELMWRSWTEAQVQSAVKSYARAFGWRYAHFHDTRREVRPGVLVGDADAAGFPDTVLVRGARVMFVECKREGPQARWKPGQREWIAALAATGTVEVMVVSPSTLEDLLDRLRHDDALAPAGVSEEDPQ